MSSQPVPPRGFAACMNQSRSFFHPDKRPQEAEEGLSAEELTAQFNQVKDAWDRLARMPR